MNEIEKFCSIIRKRSAEHAAVMERISDLPGATSSILRQELDSMVRVIYLLSIQDIAERRRLVGLTLSGQKWRISGSGKNIDVTDRAMVDIANQIHGWALSVYRFGCSFIHLSNLHDYDDRNPLDTVDVQHKIEILEHLRKHHGGPQSVNPTFKDISSYFPSVFEKIKGNLECYIEDLEADQTGMVL